jgi:hypothetical protein
MMHFVELDALALEPNRLAGSADAASHHIDRLGEPGGARLFFFGVGNPAAVFSTIGEAERVEKLSDAVLLHQACEIGGDFHGTVALISPKLNANRVAELFASLLPNGLQDAQNVLLTRGRHQGACIRDAFEDDLDRDPAFHAELTFDIMRKPDEGAPSGPTLNPRGKRIFPHSSHSRFYRG